MFIKDLSCISAQPTYEETFFEGELKVNRGNRYVALEPAYGNLIPAGLLRRMGKAVRIGVGAGLPLIQKNPDLDGIILGTANGGLDDCLKFLNQIVDYNEGTLTPTNFVQSTPNAVAGNLALMSKNTGYNATHVNKGLAFEGVLMDAFLLFGEGKAQSLLLGSIEEISDYNYNIDQLAGSWKKEETTSETLLNSATAGTVCGEAAVMFVAEAEKSDNSIAEIVDVEQINFADEKRISEKLIYFLKRNKIDLSEIDTLILGYNGDSRSDHWYNWLRETFFPESTVYNYKNLIGDFPTAVAFGVWMGAHILAGKNMPNETLLTKNSDQKSKKILLYNHHKGVQNGFILMSGL
ncbi:beta-ketoacyl synthase chain length factor [Dyadobacter subterraneus]|uniref:Beta-ketoacyl synthase chain length factor n=1 Tax=Dyadobacter subterraneus TaxID=2773304 RepID=A0ABR9WF19_9BACT|nr:beta-ketoacyl synthase chain length factor [Dyadobacter subterraneus]MBE9464090.1 beta-ketoacyl synthase chain length factor [Dyadobacter subterraneus]